MPCKPEPFDLSALPRTERASEDGNNGADFGEFLYRYAASVPLHGERVLSFARDILLLYVHTCVQFRRMCVQMHPSLHNARTCLSSCSNAILVIKQQNTTTSKRSSIFRLLLSASSSKTFFYRCELSGIALGAYVCFSHNPQLACKAFRSISTTRKVPE